jgi:integrase
MSDANHSRIPSYCKHRATGQAVVRLNGRDHYLGKHGTAASKEEYNRLIREWLAHERRLPSTTNDLSLNEVMAAYWDHCGKHYRKPDGTPTSEVDLVRLALRPVKELYGRTIANEFGPSKLKAVRQALIDRGLCRNVVNKHVGRIKLLFRWAVENELVLPAVYHGLQAVGGLRRGRSDARETEPVRPVPETILTAALPFMPAPVRAMVELQLLTAMRPGEACLLRGCDLDMTGRIWVYRPESHKTEHHGHRREIYLGPKAQEVVRPWLKLETTAYLFSPQEAQALRCQQLRERRKTKVQPSQRSRRKRHPRRSPGDRYDVASYRRAIRRACDQAFPLPNQLGPQLLEDGKRETKTAWWARLTDEGRKEVRTWQREHSWHPHQLRHNAGTRLRKEFGVELARIILGHATAFTTEIYAEADREQAMQIMERVG